MLFSLQKTHVTKLVSTLLEGRYGDLYTSKQHECSVFAKLNFAKDLQFRKTGVVNKFGLHCFVLVNCLMVIVVLLKLYKLYTMG